MKILFVFILLSISIFPQDRTMVLHGNEIQLGMSMDNIWDLLKPDLNVVEDKEGNFYVSDDKDNPVGIIYFKDEKVIKVVKDWGTTFKSNVGQVFQTLWKIFRQYGEELDSVKVIPLETYTPKGDRTSLQFYIKKNRYIDVTIQHSVTISEVLEDRGN
jgi:hypothetical protein